MEAAGVGDWRNQMKKTKYREMVEDIEGEKVIFFRWLQIHFAQFFIYYIYYSEEEKTL